jgi:hypothetical protein
MFVHEALTIRAINNGCFCIHRGLVYVPYLLTVNRTTKLF